MNFNSRSSQQRLPSFLSIMIVLLILLAGGTILYSECQVTSSVNHYHWAKNTKVYYNYSSIADSQIRSSIQSAINSWNSANLSNGTGVQFVTGTPPAGAPTLTFQLGTTYTNDPSAAASVAPNPPGSTTLSSATITFYTGATLNGGLIYDPSPGAAGSYYDLFLKEALHETGHTMGLNDVSPCGSDLQHPQESVMNCCGGKNDFDNNMSKTVKPCDNTAIQSSTSPYSQGGGGGGGGGSNPPGCTPIYIQTVRYINDRPVPIGDPVYAGCR